MSNYTSENTKVLATCEQEGNTRMLLLHEHDSGRLEYVVGSYFTEEKAFLCPKCGKALTEEKLLDYPFACNDCDENFYKFEVVGRVDYSWDWGHYFNDPVQAIDFWKRDVLGQVAHIVVKQSPMGHIRNACSHCDATVPNISYCTPANYCPQCGCPIE